MRAAAERGADVLGEYAYVCALAAAYTQLEIGRSPRRELELADLDLAWMTRDLHAGARVLVILAALALEGRVARRHLSDAAHKTFQKGIHFPSGHCHRPRGNDLAFGVTGARCRTEPEHCYVRLVCVEQDLRELGRLAETNGQKPCCKRIEGARMPCLLGAIKAFRALQRRVGRQAPRFVQEQNTVDPPLAADGRRRAVHIRKNAYGRRRRHRRSTSTGADPTRSNRRRRSAVAARCRA